MVDVLTEQWLWVPNGDDSAPWCRESRYSKNSNFLQRSGHLYSQAREADARSARYHDLKVASCLGVARSGALGLLVLKAVVPAQWMHLSHVPPA